ncbi:acyloxyacyl hydrolase [Terrimonas pollutisoli]|uniref:acyloxyacyl hydrolase n=1 Tax=Terrimonas pollutisoli TaxID=3034147 RepID=UPI0023EB51DA|nr:acyloxyacyl hydrolase [Terrimonas sp. H1YJ31]
MFSLFKYGQTTVLYVLVALSLTIREGKCQSLYPPFTKWYQDPLGLKPLELSSAFGFVWGSAGLAASIIFSKKDPSFQKRIAFYQEAGYGFGYKFPYTRVIQNEIGVLYDLRKWLSAGFGWNAVYFKDRINSTCGFGFRPFARWYPLVTSKTKLFFEYGAGIVYSIEKFPLTGTGWKADTARVGTRFNFTPKYGIGVVIKLSPTLTLQSGIRHFHVSNGNIAGIKRNPTHDSNGLFAGLLYTPEKNKDD